MDKYTLSYEGRARSRRMVIRVNSETPDTSEDYKILRYLYEHGAATIEEIENQTGLSWQQVSNLLVALMYHRYIEKLPE